jgi:hypothetical protein
MLEILSLFIPLTDTMSSSLCPHFVSEKTEIWEVSQLFNRMQLVKGGDSCANFKGDMFLIVRGLVKLGHVAEAHQFIVHHPHPLSARNFFPFVQHNCGWSCHVSI